MLKKNLSLGLVTLLSVVASGLFASCGEDADGTDKDNTEVVTGDPTSTSTNPTSPATNTASTTATTASSTAATTASTPAAATSSAPPVQPVEPTGDAAAGAVVYVSKDAACGSCHGDAGQGAALGPNISGSMTAGIGTWTFTEFQTALRTGIDPEGVKFCALMVAFPEDKINDQQVADLLAFLKSSSSDEVIEGACP